MVELKENIEKENKLKNMVSLVSTSHPSEAPDKVRILQLLFHAIMLLPLTNASRCHLL